ncbi:MAG TPA: ATP-binding protein [Vicinamibacterales bacterium]|nr:ATP-binding protein [Vicinamibacterales bacterium]
MMMRGGQVRLQFPSVFDMLDVVQVVSDRMAHLAEMDEDAVHWIGVAVRESVINAIKHGNREHPEKHVTVEFAFLPEHSPTELVVRVVDQGEGFEPEEVADPLAPENILKSSGRGIFFMRSFMDDVQLHRAPEGGMEVRMVKKLAAASGG